MLTEKNMAACVSVAAVFIVGVVMLLFIDRVTGSMIEENARQRRMQMLASVLPPRTGPLSNHDVLELEEPALTGNQQALLVYRQLQDRQVVAVSVYPVTARGYSSRIRLLVGFVGENSISGVRVIEQNETPGLGDRVHQDRSDWLQQFSGLSLSDMTVEDWALKQDQGRFDALSGATITSRRVINAVHKSAEIHAILQQTLYSSE